MNTYTIKDIKNLPDGTKLDGVQVKVTEVGKHRHIPALNKTAQDLTVSDGTGSIKLVAWEHPDCATFLGREVAVSAGPKGGVSVKKEDSKYYQGNSIQVSRTATFQFLEVHKAQTGAPPAQTSSTPPPSQQGTTVVNGAKVGMAINCAVSVLKDQGVYNGDTKAFYEEEIWKLASAIIRVSNRLETGDLAPAEANKEDVPY